MAESDYPYTSGDTGDSGTCEEDKLDHKHGKDKAARLTARRSPPVTPPPTPCSPTAHRPPPCALRLPTHQTTAFYLSISATTRLPSHPTHIPSYHSDHQCLVWP